VNDLERDLQAVLHEDARRVPTPTSAPEGLRRSVRRRQAMFGSVVGLSALAIVAAVVAGASMLLPFKSAQPAGEGQMTTGTLNGITITHPAAWSLIDPDEAGLNGPGPSTLPRIVLALSPQAQVDAFGCPGMADGEQPTFLMTVQEEPLALSRTGSAWPAVLQPLNVGAAESGCYPDWEFLRAGWTIADRTFEARVGFAPDASDDDRDAVFAAFASMAFAAPPDGITSVVLATGTAGGQEWSLIATREDDGLGLTLQGPSSGAGIGSFDPSLQKLQISSHAFGEGPDRELVLFGAAPPEVVRVEAVEASTADGSFVSADVLDVPNKIDADLNAFALVVPPGGTFDIRGFDASGNVVISGSVGGGPEGVTEPTPFPGAALGDGRHFGYVRSVDTEARTIEFDLAYFLSGEEANQAYQEATGDSGPVPNDHFVVNDNPMLRTLTLAPDARLRLLDWNHCCDSFFDGDLALFAEAIGEQADVTDGDLIYRGQSQWWITVENGVVTEIEEQYSP
jgi:hypothetical protein